MARKPDRTTSADRAKADPEQFQRFLDAARELGCEENFGRFEKALPRILRAAPVPVKPKTGGRKKDGAAD